MKNFAKNNFQYQILNKITKRNFNNKIRNLIQNLKTKNIIKQENKKIKYYDKEEFFYLEGSLEEGKINGVGKLITKDLKYIGEFNNGTITGRGKKTTKYEIYVGYFKNFQKSGKGKLKKKNGEMYHGNFYKNKIVGKRKKN